MALKAKYRGIEGCTVKILHIVGNAKTGWHANATVSNKHGAPLQHFQVSAPFVDGQHPFDALYSAIGKLSMFSNVEHDVKTELNAETIDTLRAAPAEEKKPPKSRARKKKVD